mmetsp:Transcript_25415/g.45118  ORF Transcript_25415/g.45118 Transcript_25415/m.45118 type:complete len:94 (+) Transcript_25415:207-488(+)
MWILSESMHHSMHCIDTTLSLEAMDITHGEYATFASIHHEFSVAKCSITFLQEFVGFDNGCSLHPKVFHGSERRRLGDLGILVAGFLPPMHPP